MVNVSNSTVTAYISSVRPEWLRCFRFDLKYSVPRLEFGERMDSSVRNSQFYWWLHNWSVRTFRKLLKYDSGEGNRCNKGAALKGVLCPLFSLLFLMPKHLKLNIPRPYAPTDMIFFLSQAHSNRASQCMPKAPRFQSCSISSFQLICSGVMSQC